MPIKPNPYKLICPKCKGQMEKNNLNIIDEILTLLKVK
jgi:hypothetical protein